MNLEWGLTYVKLRITKYPNSMNLDGSNYEFVLAGRERTDQVRWCLLKIQRHRNAWYWRDWRRIENESDGLSDEMWKNFLRTKTSSGLLVDQKTGIIWCAIWNWTELVFQTNEHQCEQWNKYLEDNKDKTPDSIYEAVLSQFENHCQEVTLTPN